VMSAMRAGACRSAAYFDKKMVAMKNPYELDQ